MERGIEEKKLRRSEKAREEAQAVDQSRVKSQPLSCRIGERNLSYMLYVLEVIDIIYIIL